MRILHILDHSIPTHSGYAFRTLSILREQKALGWQTYHLTSPKQPECTAAEEVVDGIHFYRTPEAAPISGKLPGLGELGLMGTLARRIGAVAERIRPDVLHAHSPALNGLPALRVGRRLGVPVVYEVRAFWEDAAVDHGTSRAWGLRYRLTRQLETFVLRQADAVTTICEGLKRDIVARGVPEAKVTIIPNGVDVGAFAPGGRPDEALREELGLKDATVIGFIGSFYAYEGLDVLLRALPKVLSREPSAQVLLVGGGPQEARLKALALEMGIAPRVRFCGRVPHGEISRYYSLVDILAYPRVPLRLTELVTPLKPLEAMAQGKLLLASSVGGHRELIRDGETGLLFEAGDPDALADALLAALDRRGEWPRIQHAARRFVETERNWPDSISRYRDVYASALGSCA